MTRQPDTPRGNARAWVTVEEAAKMLGIGRTLAYSLVRQGRFPTPVIEVGDKLRRIPLQPLLDLLAGTSSAPAQAN